MTKIVNANENPLYICGETAHTGFECTSAVGEALIDLVHQYPPLWDKQDAKYKDSNYKDFKSMAIAESLYCIKEDVIKKRKSLRYTFVRQKNH